MFQPLNEFYKEVLEREKRGKIPGYYAIIPEFILEDKDLSAIEKVLYGEISALANKFGFCYANNSHFTEVLNCHLDTLRKSLKKLKEKEYIRIEIEKGENGTWRKLWITSGKPVYNFGGGVGKNPTPVLEKILPQRSNTIKKIYIKDIVEKPVFGKEGSQEPA